MNKKTVADWEAIEIEWRAGIKSVLQISKEHDVSHTAINKRFKRLGVPRNLAEKIRQKADALVSADAVSAQVSTETTPRDAEIIDANAEILASVRRAHRADISRSRNLAMALLGELEGQTDCNELLQELGEIMREEGASGQDKRHDLYQKIISSPQRIDSLKKLSEALKNLIGLEREAYAIDAPQKHELSGPGGAPVPLTVLELVPVFPERR